MNDLIHLWKDEFARERNFDEHPSGAAELDADVLGEVNGGAAAATRQLATLGCCDGFTNSASCWGSCQSCPVETLTYACK